MAAGDDEPDRGPRRRLHAERRAARMGEHVIDGDKWLVPSPTQRLGSRDTDEQRAEIVRLLVRRITVFTDVAKDGKKTQRVIVEYLFSRVSLTDTDKGS